MTELKVDLGAPTPVYEQIRSQVAGLVAVGALAPGERLPASRDLARDLGIAVGTVQRAYRELETAGVVTSRRRVGTVVAEWPAAAQPVAPQGGLPGISEHASRPAPRSLAPMIDQARALVRDSRERGMSDEELLAVVRGVQADAATSRSALAGREVGTARREVGDAEREVAGVDMLAHRGGRSAE